MADYVLEGEKWGSGPFGTAGGSVSWAADASVPASFLPVISAAFGDWAKYANIAFTPVAAAGAAAITFSLAPIDGVDGALGEAAFSYVGQTFRSAAVTFDATEGWHAANGAIVSADGAGLFAVALHEIGHSIGLDHYNAAPAIMNATLSRSVTDLTASDIDGVRAIYGPAPQAAGATDANFAFAFLQSAVAYGGGRALLTGPDGVPHDVTGIGHLHFTDGSIEEADGAVLVDDLFYLSRNHDVYAAGVDPDGHYAQYGWHEGRDPDAFFSTSAYLAANPDVAAAGIDPLRHYDQYGWTEGRNPGPHFSTAGYLAANPDVAAAHIDPLAHYLQYGMAEGRHGWEI